MYKPIPLDERIPTLRAAINGDNLAEQAILDHFEGYVNKLSLVTLYSDSAQSHTYLDEDIRIQLQARILESLKSFDLEGILQGRMPRKKKALTAKDMGPRGLEI